VTNGEKDNVPPETLEPSLDGSETTGTEDYQCDECTLRFKNEKGLKCHVSKKHKLTLSPIPQVDGHSEMSKDNSQGSSIDKEVVKKPLEEELCLLPKENPKKYSVICYNKNGISCGGHHTLNEHMEWYHKVQASCRLPHSWHTSSCTVAD
jgi:hypothetical protein